MLTNFFEKIKDFRYENHVPSRTEATRYPYTR